MKYYRVKDAYDGTPKFLERPDHRLNNVGELIAGELYTEAERAKIMNGPWMFEEVNIPKNRIYFFFGARFEYDKGYVEHQKIIAEIRRGEKMQAKLAFYND